ADKLQVGQGSVARSAKRDTQLDFGSTAFQHERVGEHVAVTVFLAIDTFPRMFGSLRRPKRECIELRGMIGINATRFDFQISLRRSLNVPGNDEFGPIDL